MIRKSLVLLVIICCNFAVPVNAFNDKITHRQLTEKAIDNSELNTYIKFVGYSSGKNKELEGKDRKGNTQKYTIGRWLQEGSEDEDSPTFCRASNHFHNPIYKTQQPFSLDWLGSQMSDSPTVDASCGTDHRYSNVTFATGFADPFVYIGKRTGQDRGLLGLYDAPQEMGWDNARSYIYEALTSQAPATREAMFVKTFRAVGQTVHLLQDMAVPAHVRNDMQSHLWNNWNPLKWSNPFEKYVANNNNPMITIMNMTTVADKPSFSAPMRLTDFWDANAYTGENPSAGTDQGIAEYANANFVSDFTIFKPQSDTKHYFKYPAESSTQKVNMHIANPFSPGDTLTRKYYLKTGDGDTGYLLAGVGYLKVKVQTWPDTTTIETLPPMDDYVHADYADRLLPRAVGYSAALLDYFFRGKIKLTVATPENITFRSIKVRAENDLMGETMGVGEVKLIIRYKALSEWNMGGNQYQLNYPPEDSSPDKYTYKVSSPQNVDLTNPQALTFDFSTDTLPYFYDDMTMQLVFKGKLGNEEGAVAVSQLEPINGVYSDFTVSLPASGVYAKATGSTLGATFNELKVKATTDIPAGLSGGNFELALEYRKTGGDPFQSLPVDTEPANAAGYVLRVPEKNGVSILQPGTPVELTFDLSSVPLPVTATDVYLNIIYKNSGTSKAMAVGYRDISEPTPVDIFNNTDYVCVNNQWFPAGDPAAIALADQLGNNNGIDDDIDTFRHNISNIYYKLTSSTSPQPVGATNFSFFEPGPVGPASFKRLGFILTDYDLKYSSLRNIGHIDPADHWVGGIGVFASLESGMAVKNQTGSDGITRYPLMYNMRGKLMWGGAGTVYGNLKLPANSTCDWALLPAVP
ncbi:MAG: hypothetical protein GJV46_15620 [Geobacter sp.]|nr:hypothetical protein [Geobacter sp.]